MEKRTECGSDDSAILKPDGALIVLTQAFCPNGHNLIRDTHPRFHGFPGIGIEVEGPGLSGTVFLSPVHGDPCSQGVPKSLETGQRFILRCPECHVVLPTLSRCRCQHGGELVALNLKPVRSEASVAAICTVFGCHRSRVLDSLELLDEFMAGDSPNEVPAP